MPEALVIPGLLAIDPHRWDGAGPAEVVRGALAGKAALPELSDWKRELWLVPREVAARQGVRMVTERELANTPRLRARVTEAALVVVDDAVGHAASRAGERVVFVAYHRVAGGGGLEVHGGGVVRGFSAVDFDLLAQMVERDEDGEFVGSLPVIEHVYDRVLRALTGGELSLYDVDLAEGVARLSAGEFGSYEEELAEIEAMAAERRVLGEALLTALGEAEADECELPGGYVARREREPGFTLRSEGELTVIGGPIVVGAEERWIAEDVQDFTPRARKIRRDRVMAAQQVRNARREASPRVFTIAVVCGVVLVILMVLLR